MTEIELQKNNELLTKVVMLALAEQFHLEVIEGKQEAVDMGNGVLRVVKKSMESEIIGVGKPFKDRDQWLERRFNTYLETAKTGNIQAS